VPSKLNKIRTNKAMWTGPKGVQGKRYRTQGYRDTRIQIHMHRDTGYWILEQAT